jgi:electron transfer flavoprotein-quinone oxidoreductase
MKNRWCRLPIYWMPSNKDRKWCLIKGGQTSEYSAHVIPEGGLTAWASCRRRYSDSGDAAGFSMNIGVTVRGMEYAMATGYYAAQAAIKARRPAVTMPLPWRCMKNSSAEFCDEGFPELQGGPPCVDNPRFFNRYPQLAGDIMRTCMRFPWSQGKNLPDVDEVYQVHEMFAFLKDFGGLENIAN